jgi:molybdenum cofactor cytidylyltransferase
MVPRAFAIIPAAGHSTRMGRPKLLMPLDGRPLLLHTIEAWRRSRVDQVLVVVRPGDGALADVVGSTGAVLVVPENPPPDMKASIQAALRHIERYQAPEPRDAFLVAPADMPRLSPAVINRLIDKHFSSGEASILVPTLAGRRGHPVLFPWQFAAEVHGLPAEAGLNAIVEGRDAHLVACEDLVAADEYPFADIDTPEDFRRLRGES